MGETLNLLIVEDEINLGKTLTEFLRSKRFEVDHSSTVKESKLRFEQSHYHVALIDIGLPDGDGLSLARWMRSQRKDTVLIFCSALNDPSLKVEGLELGAEDYITKPFDLKELTLRLDRILKARQLTLKNPDQRSFGKLIFWPKKFEIQDAHGEIYNLGQKECAILEYLLENKGNVVSRDELIENIWGAEAFPTNRTVDNYMVKLRRWMETDSTSPLLLQSIRGVGYKLDTK